MGLRVSARITQKTHSEPRRVRECSRRTQKLRNIIDAINVCLCTHSEVPVLFWYLPMAHEMHTSPRFTNVNDPTGQGEHSVRPSMELKNPKQCLINRRKERPGWHSVHPVSPVLLRHVNARCVFIAILDERALRALRTRSTPITIRDIPCRTQRTIFSFGFLDSCVNLNLRCGKQPERNSQENNQCKNLSRLMAGKYQPGNLRTCRFERDPNTSLLHIVCTLRDKILLHNCQYHNLSKRSAQIGLCKFLGCKPGKPNPICNRNSTKNTVSPIEFPK